MKNIFHKNRLERIAHLHERGGREYWNMTRLMQEQDGFSRQCDREEFLLQKGAYDGDVYSMTELARYLYRKNGSELPQALSWWRKAAAVRDHGALADLRYYPLEEKILSYRSRPEDRYADLEVRCALLTEWILTGLGRDEWDGLTLSERERRCGILAEKCAGLLGIAPFTVCFEEEPGKQYYDFVCDGLAYQAENRIGIRRALLSDYSRLIQVFFHEAGHLVVYAMYGSSEKARELREFYGISDERVRAWKQNRDGLEVPVTEEDPDTLSFGIWTDWLIYFGR